MYHDEDIRLLAGSAKKWVSGCYIYFTPVDLTNPEHLLALLELERQSNEAGTYKPNLNVTEQDQAVYSRQALATIGSLLFIVGLTVGALFV